MQSVRSGTSIGIEIENLSMQVNVVMMLAYSDHVHPSSCTDCGDRRGEEIPIHSMAYEFRWKRLKIVF